MEWAVEGRGSHTVLLCYTSLMECLECHELEVSPRHEVSCRSLYSWIVSQPGLSDEAPAHGKGMKEGCPLKSCKEEDTAKNDMKVSLSGPLTLVSLLPTLSHLVSQQSILLTQHPSQAANTHHPSSCRPSSSARPVRTVPSHLITHRRTCDLSAPTLWSAPPCASAEALRGN